MSTFYWRSNEESVEGDRPQKAPVLESRETVYASNSRADPVQGMSLRESFVTKILSFFIQPNAANKKDSAVSIKPVSIILLTAMALIMTTGFLEEFYLNSVQRDAKKQSRNHCCDNDGDDEGDEDVIKDKGCEENENETLKKNENFAKNSHEEEKLKSQTNVKEIIHFNKETSSLPIMLTAAKTAQITSICAAQQPNTTLETSVSLKTTTTTTPSYVSSSSSSILSSLPSSSSSFSCCSSLSTTKQNVKSLKSR